MLFEKADVNGDKARPVFAWLQNVLSGTLGNSVKWNFTKFLIDADGKPYKRYAPTTSPKSMEKDIVELLKHVKNPGEESKAAPASAPPASCGGGAAAAAATTATTATTQAATTTTASTTSDNAAAAGKPDSA